jgi:hypothetical protein
MGASCSIPAHTVAAPGVPVGRSDNIGAMSENHHEGTPPDPSGIEEAHDVLAAEEFAMPLRDSRMPQDPSGIQDAHDVLAAEEFAMPLRDSRMPPDPTGIQAAHDVLAAEEFAMPTGGAFERLPGAFDLRSALPALLLAVLAALLLVRRRRR